MSTRLRIVTAALKYARYSRVIRPDNEQPLHNMGLKDVVISPHNIQKLL